MLPLFKGEGRDEDPEYFWEHEGNRAVRVGDWELVALRNGDWELYDLESDPFETKNVVNSNPGIAQQLMAQYDRWAGAHGVRPWPLSRQGKWAAWPPPRAWSGLSLTLLFIYSD